MRITEQTRYALRIIAACARRHPARVRVGDLSRETGITEANIFKLLKTVTKVGFLESSRGPGGGVAMTLAPDRLMVGQVVRVLESRFYSCAPVDLLTPAPPEQDDIERRVNEAIGRGLNAFLAELDHIPISFLLRDGT
ncbi:MAG: Rrf2 family transcriptional regulator [Xanthobacteraceae bacterium]|nr:MAG: Rrf2 family transcriptional regulator [Xanthobacteraceae bacterium]